MDVWQRIREDGGLMRRVVRLVMGVLGRTMAAQVPGGDERARPGAIVAVQTFGDSLSFHPHMHVLVTDGVFREEAGFHGYLEWDAGELVEKVRASVVASFTRLGLLRPEV